MKQQRLPNTSLSELEYQAAKLDSELDHMCWRGEVGLEVDMVKWYNTIDKIESIQREIARQRYEEDPFTGDPEANDPPALEPEYDPAWEWYEMTSAMRRGE